MGVADRNIVTKIYHRCLSTFLTLILRFSEWSCSNILRVRSVKMVAIRCTEMGDFGRFLRVNLCPAGERSCLPLYFLCSINSRMIMHDRNQGYGFQAIQSRTESINHGKFCLKQGIKCCIFTNCLVQGATIHLGWELVWLVFDVRDFFVIHRPHLCLEVMKGSIS